MHLSHLLRCVKFHVTSEQGGRLALGRADLPSPPSANPNLDLVIVRSGHTDSLVCRTEGSAIDALVMFQLRQLHTMSPEI